MDFSGIVTAQYPSGDERRLRYAFFMAAHRPKYLLRLLSARHLAPYTHQQPQLTLVERVSTAFFNAYLKDNPGPLAELVPPGSFPGIATLVADP